MLRKLHFWSCDMLDYDDELIPIRCPFSRCNAEFAHSIGRLKAASGRIRCLACDRLIEYDPEQFLRNVEQFKQSYDDALRRLLPLKPPQ